MVVGEDGTVFRPMNQVARSGDAQTSQFMVPARIGHHVKTILCHTDTRVFAASGNIEVCPFITPREKNWRTMMLEVNAILAECIAYAGSA